MKPYDRPTDSLPISRRTVIMNTGLAAAAVACLSSCTTYGTPPATQPSAPASGQGSGGSSQGVTTTSADIPVGSGKIFPDAQTVITQPKKGQFRAFSAVCTHQGCIVNAVTNTINCPCHGSKYSITDGSVVNPPATQPLAPKMIKISGDKLVVS